MPVHKPCLLLGVLILLLIAAGCQPTSEAGGLSALATSYQSTSAQATPAASPVVRQTHRPAPAASPRPETEDQPTLEPQGCREPKGTIFRKEIPSSYLKEPLEFRVYLPPCYPDAGGKPYPLLVLLHGSIFTDEQWDNLGMDETADRLIAAGKIPPLIIVMPFEEQTLANPYQKGFGTAISRELLPWLEEEYRLCEERSCRAVGGISRGAAWAIHIGFGDWQLFGSIGAHSLPPFWGDLNSLPHWLADIPAGQRPRVFMDVGRSDPYLQPASQFEKFLADNYVPHEWYLFTGAHDEKYWSAHVEQYLLWYSEAWQER